MRRPFVTSTCALALALLPVGLLAQTPAQQPTSQSPTTQQPPAGQPPAGQPPAGQPPTGQPPAEGAAAQPPAADAGEPKLGFTSPAGLLLVQVKPDQVAAFEEMSAKLKSSVAATQDAELRKRAEGWKVYKAAEGMGGNALYVILIDPALTGVEYNPLDVLAKTMTPDQLRDAATQEMFKRYAAAFAGVNKLNLSPVGAAAPGM